MPLHAFCWGFTQEASNKQQNMRVILGLPGIFGDRSRPLSRSAILGDFNLGVVGSSPTGLTSRIKRRPSSVRPFPHDGCNGRS
jgi:hypothetical protein